jgi:plastocyanin
MRRSLIAVLILSVVFGAGFAAGGAEIYGSPFVSVTPADPDATQRANERQNLRMALTILIAPVARGIALAVCNRAPALAISILLIGAIGGAMLGMTTKFAYFWEWFFLITVRLPMCFVAVGIAASSQTVEVEGVVTYDGKLPPPIPVSEAGTTRQLIEVDPKTKGLKDAVVWLEGVPEPRGDREVTRKPVVMDQKNFFFLPHVLAVRSGQVVEFRNSDVANHGVRASSLEPGNQFNVMIPFGGSYTHRFVTSKHPVAIGCPIHSSMAAWIFVFDHRYYAVTDKAGRFSLPPVPVGRFTLHVHHPDGGLRKSEPITLKAGEAVRLRINFHDGDRKTGK